MNGTGGVWVQKPGTGLPDRAKKRPHAPSKCQRPIARRAASPVAAFCRRGRADWGEQQEEHGHERRHLFLRRLASWGARWPSASFGSFPTKSGTRVWWRAGPAGRRTSISLSCSLPSLAAAPPLQVQGAEEKVARASLIMDAAALACTAKGGKGSVEACRG